MKEKNRLLILLSHAFIGIGFFFVYVHHVRSVFETRTNFGNLSKLGREALLRKEDAMYFSFYKMIVEADDFYQGFNKLFNVTTLEYPSSVNVVKRFHVLPEIIIGYLYHNFNNLSRTLQIPTMSCWVMDKSGTKENTLNCDGIGEPFRFYLEYVWILGGLTVLILYMYGSFLSENFFGGIYAVVLYIIFHKNASKIYERPVARENFAFPFIFSQMFIVTMCFEKFTRSSYYRMQDRIFIIIKLTILTTIAQLSWQFSSVIFATQILIIITQCSFGLFSRWFCIDYTISQFLSSLLSCYLSYENRKYFLAWHNGPAIALLSVSAISIYKSIGAVSLSMKEVTASLLLAFSCQGTLTDFLELSNYTKEEDNPYKVYRDLILHWGLQRKSNFTTSLLACYPEFGDVKLADCWELLKSLFVKPYCLYGVVLLAKFLRKWRIRDVTIKKTEEIERARKYVLEDFLEENSISMQEMSNKHTEKELTALLELLQKCNYDYELYKEEKNKVKKAKKIKNDDFMNHVKKLKDQISENEKRKENSRSESFRDIHESQQTLTGHNSTNQALSNQNEDNKSKDNFKELPSSASTSTSSSADTNATNTTHQTQDAKPREFRFHRNDLPNQNFLTQFGFHYIYSVIQFLIFAFIGFSVKKLFFLCYTQGCVIAPTLYSKFWYRKQSNIFWTVSIVVFLTSIIDPGLQNLEEEYLPVQTDADELENMLEWINLNTEKTAVFGGPVEIIGTVYLATNRPIVNHPHLDMRQISDRTESVYSVFSRQQSSEIYNQCTNLKIQYLILSFDDCLNITGFECDILSIWDDMQPTYKKNPQFCSELINKKIPSFLKAYANKRYGIVEINSQSVQLNLKSNKLPEMEM